MVHTTSITVPETRPIAAFDCDGTLSRKQLLALLFPECYAIGMFPKWVNDEFERIDLEHRDRKISFDEFDRLLVGLFAQNIIGKRQEDLERAGELVFEKHRDWLYIFTRTLLAKFRATHQCVAITGSVREVISHVAPYWGFDHSYATVLEVGEDGCYTGRDEYVPVLNKQAAIQTHIAEIGGTLAGSLAIGDTVADIKMLQAVERPIAFNPNTALAEVAEQMEWPIVDERKDCIKVLSRGRYKMFSSAQAESAVEYVLSLYD